MIVTQAPSTRLVDIPATQSGRHLRRFPVYISANIKEANNAYWKALNVTISRHSVGMNDNDASLAVKVATTKPHKSTPKVRYLLLRSICTISPF